MSQFYALMSDNTVKHISLKEEIVTEIRRIREIQADFGGIK